MAAPAPVSPVPSPAKAPLLRRGWLRRRWVRVTGLVVLILFALLASQAWLLPHVLTQTVPAWLKDKTGRDLRFREVSFNPFTLHLQAKEVSLMEAGKPLARLGAADIQGSWSTLTHFAWTANRITLTRPEVDLRIAADGSLDWVRFLDAFPKSDAAPSDSVPRVLLNNVTIDNAAVRLEDGRPGATEKKLDLSPICSSWTSCRPCRVTAATTACRRRSTTRPACNGRAAWDSTRSKARATWSSATCR
jgi:hypothetical protein